jgi:hypothetical protein
VIYRAKSTVMGLCKRENSLINIPHICYFRIVNTYISIWKINIVVSSRERFLYNRARIYPLHG